MSEYEDKYKRTEEDQIYNSPQKWFVREKWVQNAVNRKRTNGRDFIRFLTLTSTKIYDIEFFRENELIATTKTGYNPESITFCEYVPERYARIQNRLPGARAFLGSFEQFVGAGDLGQSNRASKWFPYDVINLDFTRPCFNQKGKKTSHAMDAIEKVFDLQKLKKQSFSFFLTLPALKSGDDSTGISKLNDCLSSNLRNEYGELKDKILEKYPRKKFPSYREFLLFMVPKLIIRYGQNFTFDVICQERYTYIAEGAKAVMITFIFDCEYVGLPNGYGGENPSDILAESYPLRIMDLLEKEFENINEKFERDVRLKEKCEGLKR